MNMSIRKRSFFPRHLFSIVVGTLTLLATLSNAREASAETYQGCTTPFLTTRAAAGGFGAVIGGGNGGKFYADGDITAGFGALIGGRCNGVEGFGYYPWSFTLIFLKVGLGWTGIANPEHAHYGNLNFSLSFGEEFGFGFHSHLLVGRAFDELSLGARNGIHAMLAIFSIEVSHQFVTWQDGSFLHSIRFGITIDFGQIMVL